MRLTTQLEVCKVFEANSINTCFSFVLAHTSELALAVNLKRKWAVQLEITPQGIFCESWLAAHSAQHESHRRLDCFYSRPATSLTELCAINDHLIELLECSAGGAQ